MFKDVLNHMEHATWYAQAGLLIFVAVFIAAALRALLTPRGEANRWAETPLEDGVAAPRANQNGAQR